LSINGGKPDPFNVLIKAIILFGALIAGWMIFSPIFYTILDASFEVAFDGLTIETTGYITVTLLYSMFYYGIPSIFVLGLIGVIVTLYNYMRRTYYASEEVYG